MQLTKLDAAKIQLEAAIELHMDKASFIPAITLAGAAEEILGKALPSGQQTAKQELSQALLTKYQLTITEKELNDQYLNKARNLLKHFGDSGVTHVDLEPETESLNMLARALTNYIMLSLPPSPVIKRGLTLIENAYRRSIEKST